MKGPLKYLNDRLPYPYIYSHSWNPYPFIYPKREKGTPFGRSLFVWVIIGRTHSPGSRVCWWICNNLFTHLLENSFWRLDYELNYNNVGAFKQEKEKQKQKRFTYSINCTWKLRSPHKARTCSSLKLDIASINFPLLDVFVLNWTERSEYTGNVNYGKKCML